MSKIPVMEIFGPTIQGEGMVIGQKTMFVRTAGCDYACSWCDSSFTWDGTSKKMIRQMEAYEIWEELKRVGQGRFSFVTISGGNPALLKNLDELIQLLRNHEIKIGLETQGSKWQDWFEQIDELTLSPKPPSSGMVPDLEVLDSIVNRLNQAQNKNRFSIKIVIFDEYDYQYAKQIHKRYGGVPFYLQVGNEDLHEENNQLLVMKLLRKYEALIDRVIEDANFNDIKVLPQLHTYVWGNKKGV